MTQNLFNQCFNLKKNLMFNLERNLEKQNPVHIKCAHYFKNCISEYSVECLTLSKISRVGVAL